MSSEELSESAEDDDEPFVGPTRKEPKLKIKLKLPHFSTVRHGDASITSTRSDNSEDQKSVENAGSHHGTSCEGDFKKGDSESEDSKQDMEEQFSESLYVTPHAERTRNLGNYPHLTVHPTAPLFPTAVASHTTQHDTPSHPPPRHPRAPPKFQRSHTLRKASSVKSLSPFDWNLNSNNSDASAPANLSPSKETHAVSPPVHPRKRGHLKTVRQPVTESSESEVQFVEETRPKRKRGQPRKAKPQPRSESEEPLPSAVALYTEIEMPRVVQRGKTAKSTKLVPQASQVAGPCTLSLEANWGDFVKIVCQTAGCSDDELVLGSLRWSWVTVKGASKHRSPITTANGFEQMIKNIKNMNEKDRNAGMNSRSQMDSTFTQDEALDIDLTSLIGQKKTIDQHLEPIVERILDKYPVGRCNEHPDIHCIKYEPNQWHFHLDNNRVRVFAMAVLKKEVNSNLTEIPLSSAHFKRNQTIGYHNRQAGSSTPTISSSVQGDRGAAPPQSYSYPSTPMNMMYPYGPHLTPTLYGTPFGYPPSYPHYPIYGAPPPALPPLTPLSSNMVPAVSTNALMGPLDARSNPPVPKCDLKEWCDLMNLGETIYNGLVKLRFQVGDSLDGMPDSEWQRVGLTWLEWQRVLEAYRRYKVETTR
ncbi:hypothetical protein C8R42DRAFT_716221 [Lentinula raphanica]|nr:hypothetical protein C8R42DRAFT_716221 [Lentinula raphanica]